MTNFKNLKQLAERLQALSGKSVVVGVLSSNANEKEEGSDITLLEKAVIHEFGAPKQNIPERSFLRSTFSQKKGDAAKIINVDVGKYLKGIGNTDSPFINAGRYLMGEVVKTIEAGNFEPLKTATIKAKKSSKPLIDTGQLTQGIDYEVRDE